jgi:hypothetical protein
VLANPGEEFSAAVNKIFRKEKSGKSSLKMVLQNNVLTVLSNIILSIQLEIVKKPTLTMSKSH